MVPNNDSINGLSLGGPWSGEQLGHVVIFKHSFDGLGFHLAAPVVDHHRTLILGQIEDILTDERLFYETLGLLGGLMPTDQPGKGLPRVFIQEQIEV